MTETNKERDYLSNRLRETQYKHTDKLAKDFKIHTQEYPKTYKELIEWIKKGHYELDEKRTKYIDALEENRDEDDYYGGNSFDGIIWTARKVDRDGHEAAYEACCKAYQHARDIIMTQDHKAGLEALKAFENWSYSKKK